MPLVIWDMPNVSIFTCNKFRMFTKQGYFTIRRNLRFSDQNVEQCLAQSGLIRRTCYCNHYNRKIGKCAPEMYATLWFSSLRETYKCPCWWYGATQWFETIYSKLWPSSYTHLIRNGREEHLVSITTGNIADAVVKLWQEGQFALVLCFSSCYCLYGSGDSLI